MTMLLGAVRAGDVLARKYRVERILGAGGMGVVVAATHELLRERVAVKLLSPERTLDKSFVRRFLSEARATVKLRSEHVARVFDVGTLDDGTPFIVMEYLHGQDLACHLNKHGPIEPPRAIDYLLQACAGLAEAHNLGIVHRDLKPANLFLSARPDGSPLIKVLDFGLAKRSDDSIEATKSGQLVGSPNYMAPEQVSAPSGVDARIDVWALGVILYEFLSGTRPFAGVTVSEIFAQILHGKPAPLRERVPTIAPELEAVVTRCLERDRDRRFDHVDALRAALSRCIGPSAAPNFVVAPPPNAYRSSQPSPEATLLLTRTHEAPYPGGRPDRPGLLSVHGVLTATHPAMLAPHTAPLNARHSAPPSVPLNARHSAPPSAPTSPQPAPSSHPSRPSRPSHPSSASHASHASRQPSPAPPLVSFSATPPRPLDPSEPWANSSQVGRSHGWVWPLRAALVMAALAFSTLVAMRSRHLIAATKRDGGYVSTPALGTPAPNPGTGTSAGTGTNADGPRLSVRSPSGQTTSAALPAAPKPVANAATRATATAAPAASAPPTTTVAGAAPISPTIGAATPAGAAPPAVAGAAPPAVAGAAPPTVAGATPASPPIAAGASPLARPSPPAGRPTIAAAATPVKPLAPSRPTARPASPPRRPPEPSTSKPRDEKSDLFSDRTW